MERERLLDLVTTLARRFEALELPQPSQLAQRYYEEVKAGRSQGPRHEVHVHRHGPWHAELIERWMGMLRLPPYENRYPVLQMGEPCPICKRRDAIHAAGMLPGSALYRCGADDKAWLCVE